MGFNPALLFALVLARSPDLVRALTEGLHYRPRISMSVGRGFTPAAKSYSIEVSMFILFSQGLLVVAASPRACPGSPRGVTPTPVLARSPIFIFDHAGVPHPDRAGVLTEHGI